MITKDEIVFSNERLFGTGINNVDVKGEAVEESREYNSGDKSDRPYYRIHEALGRELILISLRKSGWKIRPAARLLGLNHVSFRSKLELILTESVEEFDGDLDSISRRYGIPPGFLRTRLGRTDADE